ncbi:MAG TPA: hypothetical protein VIO57_12355 [Chloroflexota bacterium]|jgi:hypothetical protein
METCGCGASLRTFWVWRDSKDVLHASAFKPSSESEQALYATTARDALLPLSGNKTPKHDVRSVSDPSQAWEGRCAATLVTTRAAI